VGGKKGLRQRIGWVKTSGGDSFRFIGRRNYPLGGRSAESENEKGEFGGRRGLKNRLAEPGGGEGAGVSGGGGKRGGEMLGGRVQKTLSKKEIVEEEKKREKRAIQKSPQKKKGEKVEKEENNTRQIQS